MIDNVVTRNEKLQSMTDDMNETMASISANKSKFSADLNSSATDIQNKVFELESTRQNRTEHRNDWLKGAKGAVEDALNTKMIDPLSNIAGNTGNTAGNTGKISDTLDATEEDLQYLRDIAERETINRFTTAEINVEMNNSNNINSEMDIDGIVDSLGEKLEERLEVVAEGVYI